MAIATTTPQKHSVEEYLAREVESDIRHEYRNGAIIPITGGTPEHNKIISALNALLCAVTGADGDRPLHQSGVNPVRLDESTASAEGCVGCSMMHLAKGLEFRAVVVMACDDEVIPLQERIEAIADEAHLEEETIASFRIYNANAATHPVYANVQGVWASDRSPIS